MAQSPNDTAQPGEPGIPSAQAAGIENDEVAAAWAAALAAEPPMSAMDASAAERIEPERTLNQDEIDSLLGLSRSEAKGPAAGILAIVNPNDITYERLPMLEVVFDRLERILTSSVRNFTSQGVDINLAAVSAQRFGDYLNSVQLPAMIAVIKAVEWDNYGIITIDSALIYSVVDVLLGGRRGTGALRIEGRPYTTIEASLVERLIKLILADLSQAFAPITNVEFRLERIETNPRFAAIARPGNACVVFKLGIHFEDRGGSVEFLLPYATLEPVRDLLLQMFMGEKFGRDPIWENHLAGQIWITEVELEAVLEEQTLPLGEVMAFEVGTLLPLDGRLDTQITLRCGDIPMLQGRLGRVGDRVAVAIEERLNAGGSEPHE
jgi:flagellar motor switch protein FliM